jgi:hypothetical protein
VFSFPNPVNEVSARLVAAGVVVMCLATLALEGIGATLSVAALVAWLTFDDVPAAYVFIAMIAIAATLESVFGYCLGCKIFAVLMRVGVIPESACAECNDIWSRTPAASEPATR